MNLNDLVKQAHSTAKIHGFWDVTSLRVPEKLALIHSEVSEALEVYRVLGDDQKALAQDVYIDTGKPIGFNSELADIVIRVADLAGALEIDLDAAIVEKLEYNKTRDYMHGKVC